MAQMSFKALPAQPIFRAPGMIGAFQLVAGRNPDTSINSQRMRLGYHRVLSEVSEISLGFGLTRDISDLHSEPNAVGPRVRFGHALDRRGRTTPIL